MLRRGMAEVVVDPGYNGPERSIVVFSVQLGPHPYGAWVLLLLWKQRRTAAAGSQG